MHKILFAVLMAGASLFAEEISWNTPETLEQWKSYRNVKCELKDNVLVLTEIKADCQLISPALKLDASKYNCFSFRYRATGTKKSFGELYYAHPQNRFNDRAKWRIPALIADGKWHIMELTKANLTNPVSWFEGGMVTRLRFDPTNAPGGKVEITDIKFYFKKEQPLKATVKKK